MDAPALLIAGLVVGALSAFAAAVMLGLRRENAIARRLAAVATISGEATSQSLQQQPRRWTRVLGQLTRAAQPKKSEEVKRLRSKLQQGGLTGDSALPLFLAAKLLLAIGGLSLFLWENARRSYTLQPGPALAVLAFAAGFYAPEFWLRSRTRTRQTAIERGLPDALDLLVTCVEAGLGLDAALQRVTDEIRLAWPVLAQELRITLLEVKAGIPRVEALRRLASRTGVQELKSLAATMTQTELFGTSVALALRIQAEGIRVRRMQRAEERAAYVSVKMTIPLVLCILPTLLAVVAGPAVLNVMKNLLPGLGGGK